MNCEKIVKKHQICLGHIIRICPECIADEKNKQCYWNEYKKYNPIIPKISPIDNGIKIADNIFLSINPIDIFI